MASDPSKVTPTPFPGFPDWASLGFTSENFPYANLMQQLQSTFWALPTNSYGRWNGTGTTQALGYPSGVNPGPPQGYSGLLGGGGAGAGGGVAPQGGGVTPTTQPKATGGGGPAGDPGFGAAPSSAGFPNLTEADKNYLYRMAGQYRQDLRGQPGAHQLFFDMFPGMAPEQINALINDIGLNSGSLPSFNPQAYTGPYAQKYQALVQQMGGSPNQYGTWTGREAAQADALRRFGPNVTDFRTGKKVNLLGG